MEIKEDKQLQVIISGAADFAQVPEDVLNSYIETLYEEILKIKEDERAI